MSEGLPTGWATTTLGEVCSKPQYGWTSAATKAGGIKYVRTTDISGGKIDWESVPYCAHMPDDLKKYRLRENDILVSRAGSVGVSYRVAEAPDDAVFASYLIRFKSLDSIEPKYIELFLKSDNYWRSISEFSAGIAVSNVNASKLASLELPLAPLGEQRRIVGKLEKLLGKVDACQQRLTKIPVLLKRFRQSVLAAACSGRLTADWRETENVTESAKEFLEEVRKLRLKAWSAKRIGKPNRKYPEPDSIDSSDLPGIPDSWQWASADAICSQVTDGEHIQPPYQSKGHPMLSAKHVRDGYVTLEGAGLISDSDFKKALDRCQPVNGDILIVSVGATTGRSAIVENCRPFAIVRSVLLLKPLMSAKFLFRCLQSPWCFRWMTQASGASAQPHLYIKDTKRMPVPIPPLAEQQEIVRRVEALFALADQIEARYVRGKAHVEKLTQSILGKAFRGELVPQDPNDEPASALLERTKREKAARTDDRSKIMESQRRSHLAKASQ